MNRTVIRTLLKLLFWSAFFFALVMAALPRPPQLLGEAPDKVQHILAFATLTGLAWVAYPRVPLWRIVLGLSLYGALIEFVQAIPTLHRDSDVRDWIADTAAIAATLLILHFGATRLRARLSRQDDYR
jgi:VanZ family protein